MSSPFHDSSSFTSAQKAFTMASPLPASPINEDAENVFPLFGERRGRLDATSGGDSPDFFPFQRQGSLKRQDAVTDASASPKIEDLLLRASQMKIRASPAQSVLRTIANALSPHE